MRPLWLPLSLVAVAALGLACHESSTTPASQAVPTRPPPGGPIAGLTAAERAAFERGRAVFTRRFKPSEGLGSLYNATSCASCHSTPVPGGSAQLYRNFYLAMFGVPGAQSPIAGLPSAVVPAFGGGVRHSLVRGRMPLPSDPLVTVAQRNAIPIFGTGLFEFVRDATIQANADPDDANADGISGRYNTDFGAIGRLGVKAQSNNIEVFTRGPLFNQMGITSDPFNGSGATASLGHAMIQVSADPNLPSTDSDGVADPEISRQDLGDLIAFTRFLAPPAPMTPFSEAAVRGERLFDSTGCTRCHVPQLASTRGPVRAYTDLLLHDMGPDLADGLNFGVPQASIISPFHTAREFRTQPLWGVSMHAPYLHDGRAETLDEAIRLHGGEAERIRDAYLALSPDQRDDLIEFLEFL
jgi:CxxC motif-containing protein (DUF1111 family)